MLYQRIRYFLEVADCLNFTTAASNLYISQQAITKQIAALEKELGVRLFERTTRHVSLTPAGQQLRDDFIIINRQIDSSIRRARELGSGNSQSLRVGFLSALSRKDIILPATNYLFSQYPQYSVEIRLLDFKELRNQLLDGLLDLCITTSNDWKLWPEVKVFVFAQKQFQVVYSDRHPLADCKQIAPERLKEYVQLYLPQDNLLPGVEQWGKKIPCKRTIPCQDISTLLVRLELGEGFSLLTKVFEGYDNPHLRFLDVPFPEAHAEIVGICREDAGEAVKHILLHMQKGTPLGL